MSREQSRLTPSIEGQLVLISCVSLGELLLPATSFDRLSWLPQAELVRMMVRSGSENEHQNLYRYESQWPNVSEPVKVWVAKNMLTLLGP